MKKIFSISLTIVFLVSVMAFATQKDVLKIAVASNSKDAASSISNKAGRCPYYLIFSSEGKLIEIVDNPYKDAQRSAGPQAAHFLAGKGVTTVIAETFGDKMIDAMETNGMSHFKLHGIVNSAVREALNLGDGAKIAVASDGKNAAASVIGIGTHSSYYLIFNSAGELIEVVDNPHKGARSGAGLQTVDFLAKKGVTIVIAKTFGDEMIKAMKTNRMDYFQVQDSINAAVKKILNPGNQLLMKLDRNLSPESYESYRKLINIEPNGRKREFVLFAVKKGKDKVAAVFLSPASEKGRSTLRLDDNMWLYIPNVGKPIRITSLQSVVGGVFNNSDILRLDYTTEYVVERMQEMTDKYLLHLKARTKTIAYDRLKMWVDKEKILPIRIKCYTEGSMLIKTIYFKKTKDFGGGIVRPSIIETDSPLYKGYKSVMIFAKVKKRAFKNEVFTLTFMPNLESLR